MKLNGLIIIGFTSLILSLSSCNNTDCCVICDEESYVKGYQSHVYQRKNQKQVPIYNSSIAIKYDSLEIVISDNTLSGPVNNCDYGNLKNIVITCSKDYNSTYLKDDTLNDIINMSSYGKENLSEYLKDSTKLYSGYTFYLNQAPLKEDFYQFNISVEGEDGKIFSTQTDAVLLQKGEN